MPRLEKHHRRSLEAVAAAQARREKALRYCGKDPRRAWVAATHHNLMGNTVYALADRGLVEVRWAKKPYRRLVCRLTDAGRAEMERASI